MQNILNNFDPKNHICFKVFLDWDGPLEEKDKNSNYLITFFSLVGALRSNYLFIMCVQIAAKNVPNHSLLRNRLFSSNNNTVNKTISNYLKKKLYLNIEPNKTIVNLKSLNYNPKSFIKCDQDFKTFVFNLRFQWYND